MSAYDDLQMFYKLHPTPRGEIRDPWALGEWLKRKYGNHTQAGYARALEDKEHSTEWNPISEEAQGKKAKREEAKEKKKGESEEPEKKKRGRPKGTGYKQRGPGSGKGYQRKLPGFTDRELETTKKSLDEFIDLLNIIKAEEEESKPKIKEDPKDEHEDKEPIRDPFAVATWRAEREGHDLSTDEGKDRRNEIVDDIKEEGNIAKPKKDDKDIEKSEALQKISPSLAGLMAAAAGWAFSDSVVEAGGGGVAGVAGEVGGQEGAPLGPHHVRSAGLRGVSARWLHLLILYPFSFYS